MALDDPRQCTNRSSDQIRDRRPNPNAYNRLCFWIQYLNRAYPEAAVLTFFPVCSPQAGSLLKSSFPNWSCPKEIPNPFENRKGRFSFRSPRRTTLFWTRMFFTVKLVFSRTASRMQLLQYWVDFCEIIEESRCFFEELNHKQWETIAVVWNIQRRYRDCWTLQTETPNSMWGASRCGRLERKRPTRAAHARCGSGIPFCSTTHGHHPSLTRADIRQKQILNCEALMGMTLVVRLDILLPVT